MQKTKRLIGQLLKSKEKPGLLSTCRERHWQALGKPVKDWLRHCMQLMLSVADRSIDKRLRLFQGWKEALLRDNVFLDPTRAKEVLDAPIGFCRLTFDSKTVCYFQ